MSTGLKLIRVTPEISRKIAKQVRYQTRKAVRQAKAKAEQAKAA
jgi:hypothetical protein